MVWLRGHWPQQVSSGGMLQPASRQLGQGWYFQVVSVLMGKTCPQIWQGSRISSRLHQWSEGKSIPGRSCEEEVLGRLNQRSRALCLTWRSWFFFLGSRRDNSNRDESVLCTRLTILDFRRHLGRHFGGETTPDLRLIWTLYYYYLKRRMRMVISPTSRPGGSWAPIRKERTFRDAYMT